MAKTLDEIIKGLEEEQKSPELELQEKLAEETPTPVPDDSSAEKEKDEDNTDLLKQAETYVEQGRLMAIGFMEELSKLASDVPKETDEEPEKTAEAQEILSNLYTRYFGEKK